MFIPRQRKTRSMKLRQSIIQVAGVAMLLTAVAACSPGRSSNPYSKSCGHNEAKAKPNTVYSLCVTDREAAVAPGDLTGATGALVNAGDWPTAVLSPAKPKQQPWQIIFTHCKGSTSDAQVQQCNEAAGVVGNLHDPKHPANAAHPYATRVMSPAGSSRFKHYADKPFTLTIGRIVCTSQPNAVITVEAFDKASVRLAQAYQSERGSTYFLPAGSQGANRQFLCKVG
jgi:hypothetical protein